MDTVGTRLWPIKREIWSTIKDITDKVGNRPGNLGRGNSAVGPATEWSITGGAEQPPAINAATVLVREERPWGKRERERE